MNSIRINMSICLVLFLLLMQSCKTDKKEETVTESPATTTMTVKMTQAQLQHAGLKMEAMAEKNLPIELTLNGKVFTPASEKVSIHAPMEGYIRSLPWVQGMSVKKGQVLITVEDMAYLQLQQDYLQAVNAEELAEAEWKRQQQLASTRATSEKLSQEARHLYQKTRIEVMSLKQKLRMIHIDPATLSPERLSASIKLISPVNGFVQAVHSNLGDYVGPMDEILTLQGTGETMVVLNAFEKDIAGLQAGQDVVINTTSSGMKTYQARVTQVGKVVGSQGNIEVVCKLQGQPILIEGQFVTGELTLTAGKALCVPERSLVRFEGKEFVFVQDGAQQFTMTEVMPGVRSNNWVQIKNHEVLEGKQIVTDGSYTLLMTLKNVAE